ncbi:MAG: hypothetical protein IKU30_06085 [Clostridia bacterium]|nr:hypothetical protein [Clostridia bacterium]
MLEELYDLCEILEKDLKKTNEKLRMSGGELTGSDLEYVDKLTHSLKSIKAVIGMIEDKDGYSGRYPVNMSYRDDRDGRGASYRGRRGAKRDAMGRYSRAEDFRETLEDAMDNAPNDQTREKIRRIMQEM